MPEVWFANEGYKATSKGSMAAILRLYKICHYWLQGQRKVYPEQQLTPRSEVHVMLAH